MHSTTKISRVELTLFALLGALAFYFLLSWSYTHAASYTLTVEKPNPVAASVPYGAWVVAFLNWIQFALTAIALWVFNKYVPSIYKMFVSKQAVSDAINYAITTIEGAVSGKVLTVAQTNQIIEEAINYLDQQEPAIAAWAGNTIRPKIVAWLQAAGMIPAEVSKKDLVLVDHPDWH